MSGDTGRFFDRYPRFYDTSATAAWPKRLQKRYAMLIERNREFLRDKAVLDIASHDGRWSFAALQAGASRVTGIEAREHLVRNSRETFAHYGVDPSRYDFICADAFDALRGQRADTVLLLGFFYHVNRHVELAHLVGQTAAACIILDTNIIPDHKLGDERCVIRVFTESTDLEGNAVGLTKDAIVGHPSRQAVKLIFGQFGYRAEEIDWSSAIANEDRSLFPDYSTGMRATFILRRD